MKENKGRGIFSFITGGGTYKEDKFEEDAAEGHRRTTASAATSVRRSASPS